MKTSIRRAAALLSLAAAHAFAAVGPMATGGGGSGGSPTGAAGALQTNNAGAFGAYTGTACTNMFVRGLNASGAATCAAVANADLAGSIAASKLIGTDIATVGTLTAGTWNATVIGSQYGGTGQNWAASSGRPKLTAGVWSLGAISLASEVTGILPAANGGTGTATPGLVAGSNVTITGTWPNQTINSTASGTGNVANSGTPTSGQAAEWISSTQVQGVAVNGTGNYLKSAGTAAIASGKTLTVSNTLTITGTDGSSLAVGSGGTLAACGTPNAGDVPYFSSSTACGTVNGTGFVKANGASAPTVVTAPTGAVVGTSDTQTLTNKRHQARTGTTTSSATPSINTDNVDQFSITALATAVTSFTTNLTGTPVEGDRLILWIKDNGSSQTLSFGTSFAASTDLPLPTATTAGKYLYLGFRYNATAAKWILLAKLDNI